MKFSYKKALFVSLGLLTVALLSYLGYRYIAPFGKVVTNTFVQKLPGADAVTTIDYNGLRTESVILKTKATRFSLPRLSNLAEVKFRLNSKPGQSEIKLGVRGDEATPFIYRSLYFAPLATMSWDKVEENGLVLYQKNKTYASVTEFMRNLPVDKKIGSYQVDADQLVPYLYPVESRLSKTIISTPIRGSVSAYILVSGGDLNIKVSKQDINMYDGADTLGLYLSRGGAKVEETTIGDDGFADKSKSQTAPQNAVFNVKNAKPGIYKLEMKFDSQGTDSFISNIEVNQKKIIFDGNILAWGGVAINLFTSVDKVKVNTSWPEGIQKIKLNDKTEFNIKEIKKDYELDLVKLVPGKVAGSLYKITLPKGNVNLRSTGYIAFTADAYFDPQIIKMQPLTTSDTAESIVENYDYVLTTLLPSRDENGYSVSELSLSPADYNLVGDKIFFSLEVPEIEKHGGSLEIGALDTTLISK